MTISSPIPDLPSAVAGNQRLDIARTLSPLTYAIGLGRVARGGLIGLAAGAAIGTGILLAGHLRAFGFALTAAVIAVVLGLLIGAAAGAVRWPRALEAARAADRYFQLDDRLTTALELNGADTPVAFLQGRDAARHIDGLTLSRSRGRWFHRREGVVAVIAALVFAGALALGPPSESHRASAAAPSHSVRVRHAAANQVQKLTSQLHLGLTQAQLHSPAMRKLDQALARLRHQLLQASTPRTALRAVSATRQQLRQLARGLHPVNARAVAQLNSSLSRYLGKGQTRASSGPASHSALATAQALNRLAQSVSHLTPAQRAALAQALARAANTTSNNALRSALRQAASSLANSAPQSASAALHQATAALSQSAAAQAALARAGAAGAQLNGLKNQIAGTGAAPPSLSASSRLGQPNAAGRPGAGGKNGRALGSGRGSGKGRGATAGQGTRPGQGRGTGRGASPGRGNGAGKGRGTGPGAHGKGGRGAAGLTPNGRNVTVFIPGKQGRGAEIVRNGPKGAPATGAYVPYQQVVGQYAQGAHQALDRAALPPSLQGYVRRYFMTLSR